MTTFNLQLFGVEDTITASSEVVLQFEREDETIQNLRLKNFRNNLTESETRAVMTFLTSNQILLDSKTSNPLSNTAVFSAYTEREQVVSLDIS